MKNKLHKWRLKKHLTQKELAKASGLSQVTISFIENQLSNPMELTKEKLASALKVPVEKVFPSKNKSAKVNLHYWRIKKLLTQKELAKASGVSQVTISFIENQLSEPMPDTQQKLARALKVPVDKVFPPKNKVTTVDYRPIHLPRTR